MKYRIETKYYRDIIDYYSDSFKIKKGYLLNNDLLISIEITERRDSIDQKAIIKIEKNKSQYSSLTYSYLIPIWDAYKMVDECNLKINKERYIKYAGKVRCEIDIYQNFYEPKLIIANIEDKLDYIPIWLNLENTTNIDDLYISTHINKLKLND